MRKININIPQIDRKESQDFFMNSYLKLCGKKYEKKIYDVNNPIFLDKNKEAYLPEYLDLYFLYKLIILNKRLTVLEFGSGWSSLFFILALAENKKKYEKYSKKFRASNKFEIFVLENEKKYLDLTKSRINNINSKKNIKVNYLLSQVRMSLFNNLICTEYSKLPLCNPDFIYLDGPDQFNVKNKINGITTSHDDFMPMVSDLIKIEFFLIPGTIICADGRAANVQFLLKNFKREWLYYYHKLTDMHLMYLNAPLLGHSNNNRLKFYNS
jgi:hypothetical protein